MEFLVAEAGWNIYTAIQNTWQKKSTFLSNKTPKVKFMFLHTKIFPMGRSGLEKTCKL